MLTTNLKMSFMNEGFMEERVQLGALKKKIGKLVADTNCDENIA